jgi:hypothetical protein
MLIKDLSKDLDTKAMTEVVGGFEDQGNVLQQTNLQALSIVAGNGNGSLFNGPALVGGDVVVTQSAHNDADLSNYKSFAVFPFPFKA